jgi:hypothetical protein
MFTPSMEITISRKQVEIMEAACTKMNTRGHKPNFIRKAATRGISSYLEKVRRSFLLVGSHGYSPPISEFYLEQHLQSQV